MYIFFANGQFLLTPSFPFLPHLSAPPHLLFLFCAQLVESMHLLFTTYMEFQANAHFMPNSGAADDAQAKYEGADEDFGSYDNYNMGSMAKEEYK